MAAIDFPNPPLTLNQSFSAPNGVTYKWNGTMWITSSGGGGGITQADADLRYVNVAGDTMTGALTGPYAKFTGADGVTSLGFAGATKGVRMYADATRSYIEGVDYTFGATYEPLTLGGSQITLAAPVFGSSAQFRGNVQTGDANYVYTPFTGTTDTGQVRAGMQFDGTNQGVSFFTANTWRGAVESTGLFNWSAGAMLAQLGTFRGNVAGVHTAVSVENLSTDPAAAARLLFNLNNVPNAYGIIEIQNGGAALSYFAGPALVNGHVFNSKVTLSGLLTGTTATFTDWVNAGNTFNLNGQPALIREAADYTAMRSPLSAVNNITVGNTVNPSSYYTNDNHYFRKVDQSTYYLWMSPTGITVPCGKLVVTPPTDNNLNGLGVGYAGTDITAAQPGTGRMYMTGANGAHSPMIELRSGSIVYSTFEMYDLTGVRKVYMDAAGNTTFGGKVTAYTGDFTSDVGAGGGGVGGARLFSGGAANTGYISFLEPDGDRRGYIGYGSADLSISYVNDMGGSHTFVGQVTGSKAAFTATTTEAGVFSGPDGSNVVLIRGGSKAVRVVAGANGMAIQGVDQTGVTTFEPLEIYGSTVHITGPLANVGIGNAPLTNVKLTLKGQTTSTDWLIYALNSAGTPTFAVDDAGNITSGRLTGTSGTMSAAIPAASNDTTVATTGWVRANIATSPGGDFMAKNNAGFVVPQNVWTTIVWDTVVTGNSGGWYNTTTGRFTPPAGRYVIRSSVIMGSSANPTTLNYILRKNGTQIAQGGQVPGMANWYGDPEVEVLIDANGTDWFDVQATGNATSISSTANSGVFMAFPTSGVKGPPGDLASPTGVIVDFAGSTAPSGWLLCQGQLLSRTTYAALFAIIGTTYGAGDGSTTFAVPDLGGRVTAGKEATATRLTTAGSGIDGSVVGAAGGLEGAYIDYVNLPSGMVTFASYGAQAATTGTGGGPLFNINAGSINLPHKNTQPTMVINKIIKT